MEAQPDAATPRQRRYSIWGLVVAGLLFLSALGNLQEGGMGFLGALMAAGGGIALLVRSFRPPVGIGRGLATVFGGLLVAQVPFLFLAGDVGSAEGVGRILGSLLVVALGVFLLRVGFKPAKPKS